MKPFPKVLLLLGAANMGCGDPLVSPTLVTNTRILGARVEGATDPDHATVAAGQAARLRWFAVSPDGPPALAWVTTLCAAKPVSRGLPACDRPSFLRVAAAQPSAAEPSVDWTLPLAAARDGTTAINANAAFCASGEPTSKNPSDVLDGVTCPDPEESPLLATMPLFIESDQVKNSNPSLRGVKVSMGSAAWSRWTEPETPNVHCANAELDVPRVEARSTQHAIELQFPEDLSETIPVVSARSASRESIELAHFVTGGDLQRTFSTIDFSRRPYRASVHWDAPTTAPDSGQIVRFFFVLRDGRGGIDWATHAVCVVP